jgi:hypothetical protein
MIAFGIAAALAAATPARLPPVERCTGDSAFDEFRSELTDAVARKDAAALRKLAADDVRVDFGGNGGWDEFASTWDLAKPSTSNLWRELERVMALGCAGTREDGRVFPGLFEDMGDDADPFELVVVRPGGALRSAPDKNAAQAAKLEWTVANVVEEQGPEDWVKVQVRGGPSGWVARDLVISPLDYRLVAELRDGRWRIAAFVAGD